MIRYTVFWLKSARDELAALWLDASDRNAVTAAAYTVDIQLTQDAASKGRELHEGLRILLVAPLRAIFTVNQDDLTVEIVRVTSVPSPPGRQQG
jgi:hypothetical protein